MPWLSLQCWLAAPQFVTVATLAAAGPAYAPGHQATAQARRPYSYYNVILFALQRLFGED